MSFGFLRLIGAYFIFVGRGILSENTSKPRSVPRVFRIIFTKRIFSKNIPDRRIIKKSKFMHIYSPLCILGEIAAKSCGMSWLLNFRNGAIKLSK